MKFLILASAVLSITVSGHSNAADFSHCNVNLAHGCLDTRRLPDFWHIPPEDEATQKYLDREREFSKYSWKFAIASSIVYAAKDHEEPLPQLKKLGWTNIRCSTKENTCVENEESDIGFYANAWITDNRELTISFRGTDSIWKDFFKGNLVVAPKIFGRTQFDAALDFSNSIITQAETDELRYDSIVFTGHSLGGGLAQYSQRFFKKSQSIVFDPSPNRGRLFTLFSKGPRYPYNSTRVYEKGEILELLRKGIDPDLNFDWSPGKSGKSTIWLDFYADGPQRGHSIRDLAMSLTKVSAIAGSNDASRYLNKIQTSRREAQSNQ